ncbi:hypothetical protein JCM30237_17250 [Halolamina litorea]|uniref:Uncharacterized protein n=1 Tax=Halolamina litorea TaxID=1515593 RepID=A0ABD6BSI6_9EURY|nr:hypothetical protein [Halolamina litorea]
MNARGVAVGLVAVLLFSAVGGVFVGGVGAASETVVISPENPEAGAQTTHNVSIPVDDSSSNEAGGSLSRVIIDYANDSTGASFDLTGVSNDTIKAIGTGGTAGSIDSSAHYDVNGVTTEENGTKLVIDLGGNEDLTGGDYVVVKFSNVVNPPREGSYNIVGDLNPQSVDSPESGSIRIEDTTPPDVGISLTADGEGNLDAVVDSNEELSALNVTIDGSDGTVARSLTLSDFNESSGDWTYAASALSVQDDEYTATVDGATDYAGNTESNPSASDSATVDATRISVDSGNVTPAAVGGGETVSQTANVSVSGASAYGGSETVSFTVNDSVVVENASASVVEGSASVSSTATVDNGTVSVAVDSGSGGGTAAYTVGFDIDATYVGEGARIEAIDAEAIDSDNAQDSQQIAAVDVKDVTPPVITNFTLVRGPGGAQDVDLELVADEQLGGGTVNLTGDAGGTLDVRNAGEQSSNGNWTYTFDVSDGIDGEFGANVTGADGSYYVVDTADSPNRNRNSHDDSMTVNEDAIVVVEANATNSTVGPGETADQRITVDVADVSLDGGTDTVRVVLPSEAENVQLNGVENATAGAATTVDGGQAFNATLNPGNGGGVTDVQVTFDVNATYDETLEGQTLPVNASAFDSDGDSDTATAVTNVSVRDVPPTISNFTLFTAEGPQDVDLRFNASEELGTAEASFQNDLDGERRTLAGNVTLVEAVDGTYVYEANVSDGEDGQFDATLSATDLYGNAAEGDLDATLRVNETDPVVVDATVDPAELRPNETVTQNLTATVDGLSRDGNADRVRVTLPENARVRSARWGSVNGANGGNVAGTTNRSILIDVDSGDGLGTANVTVEFDAEVDYGGQLEGETVPLNVTAIDSDGAQNATTNETSARVVDTQPVISNFTVNETADGVDLTFDANEQLVRFTVGLTGDLDANRTLDEGDFVQTYADGNWTYTNESLVSQDGTYNATLDAGAAFDSDDNANPETHSAGVVVDNNPIDVVAANVTNDPVDPQSTVAQQVVVDVHNGSLDGETDTVDVTFNDSVDVTATNVSSTVGGASLTDAGTLTVEVATGSGGGVTDLTLTINVTATYGDELEGETLAVDASATDSDGDSDEETELTNVSVRDTHPVITNFTLSNESRDVNLSFNSTEALETITVETTGDSPQATLTRGSFTETLVDGNYTYEANVSDGVDGTFDASLAEGAALDNADNGNNASHTAALTVNTRSVTLTAASVTPGSVTPESTVEQNLTVSADHFGQDGGTDTLTLTLNESLNVTALGGGTVTAGESTVSGTERLDPDGDGEYERIRISLDTGDGGGTTDVTAALNATVAYPGGTEGATLAVDASATDSDGDEDAAAALANVSVEGVPPTVTNFGLNATGQDVDVSFNASEQLSASEVDLGGDLNETLTDLNGAQIAEDDWAYTANVSDGQDGYFTATLSSAVDRFGNDGADGETDSVRVNEVGPKIQQIRISPKTLWPGERTNQTLTTNVTGLSQDGINETVTYEFANESAVELRNVTAEGANASAIVTDNGTAILVNLSTGNATGSANVTLTTNLTATYANSTEGETFNVTTLVNDSLNETAGPVNTTVAVNDTVPTVTAFNLTADEQLINLTVTSNESLETLNVSLGGDLNETLTHGNFTETPVDGNYTYETNVSDGVDGNFTATLTNATDPYGNNVTVGQNDSLVVDTENVTVGPVNVTPTDVRPNRTVDQTTVLNVSDLNSDGLNDTATLTFSNGTDVFGANASVDDANTTATVTNVTDANADGFNESVTVGLNTTDALGTENLTLTVNTTAFYNGSLEGANVTLDAVVNDSDGSNASLTENVTVVDTVPTVTAFDVSRNGSTIELAMRSNERLETLRVALSVATGGNLTRADFDATRTGDTIAYTTTLADGREGEFGAELTAAVDNAGNDGAAGQNDSVTYRVETGGGQQGGQQPAPEPEPEPEPTEEVTRVDNSSDGAPLSVRVVSIEDGREVVVENARRGASVAAHLTPSETERAIGVSLSDVELTATTNGTATLTVQAGRSGAFDALPESVDPVVAYEAGTGAVTETAYTVRVTDSRLGDRDPDTVRVFTADGTELNATYIGEAVDKHGFRVDTDAERFAVALSGANVSVVDASLPAANASGVATNVTLFDARTNVTLRNTGPVAGNHTVNVTAANELVAQRTVRVDANSTRTVQISANASGIEQEGPILIEADGVDAGTIPPADERQTPTITFENADSTSTEADSPFALATLLVALAGAALLARRE